MFGILGDDFMINTIEISGNGTTYRSSYIADTIEDILELPTDAAIEAGSTCLCLENNVVYILNENKQWTE